MTGPYESILGGRIDRVLQTTQTFAPTPFDVASDDVRLSGTMVDIDHQSGQSTGIRRICLSEAEAIQIANAEASS